MFTFSAAISAREEGGEWEKALCLLHDMVHSILESSTISCNAVISACEK